LALADDRFETILRALKEEAARELELNVARRRPRLTEARKKAALC
jgi:hypothetical protein